MIVYSITSPSGKLYIGKSAQSLVRRWQNHCALAVMGRPWALHYAIRKYGAARFSLSLLAEGLTPAQAIRCEKYWISYFQSNRSEVGYNMTDGGDGIGGFRKSADAVERTAAAHRGRKRSAETCRNIGIGHSNYRVTEQTKEKIRQAMRARIASGKHFNAEHRRKISESVKAKYAQGWSPHAAGRR